MIDFTKVGEKIASCRKENNLSQEELASRLFVTRQALSKWENGTSVPSVDTLLEICALFHLSIEEILCLNDSRAMDVDPEDIFGNHDRSFIIKQIIDGNIHVVIEDVLYQMSPLERMTILKAVREGKLEVNAEDLFAKLTASEKRYMAGGAYYELRKRK